MGLGVWIDLRLLGVVPRSGPGAVHLGDELAEPRDGRRGLARGVRLVGRADGDLLDRRGDLLDGLARVGGDLVRRGGRLGQRGGDQSGAPGASPGRRAFIALPLSDRSCWRLA